MVWFDDNVMQEWFLVGRNQRANERVVVGDPTRDGSAEYRLKNEKGLLVTKQKADLEAMLDHLNIQVR